VGFLDNVKKGLDGAAKSINQAVSNQQSGSSTGPSATAGGTYDDDFIDGFHPETWLDRSGLLPEELVGNFVYSPMAFTDRQVFTTEEGNVARWVDPANGYTLDLVSVSEAALATMGTQENVCRTYAERLATSEPAEIGDVAIQGSNGPGHRELVVCIGDLVARGAIYGPAELDLDAARDGLHTFMLVALHLDG
jgi:hypothetical protein